MPGGEPPDGDSPAPVVSHIDDDPVAEPLPPLAPGTEDDEELARLDDEEAAPVEVPSDLGLADLFCRIDPAPALPLQREHEMGFSALVRSLNGVIDIGLLADHRVQGLLDRLGDRLTVAVSPEGITVRGVVRARHTPWAKVQQLTFVSRYEMLRGGLVNQLAEEDMSQYLPPVPGLKWLLRRIVGGMASFYERRQYTGDEVDALRAELGFVLTHIERRGLDIELSGPLRFVSFFSSGLSSAIEREATDRGVKVVRADL